MVFLRICWSGAVLAGAENGDQPDPAWIVPSHIQLRPMLVPIRYRNPSTTPVTIFLHAVDKDHVGDICKLAPRIRDAVMRTLHADPIPVRSRKLDLSRVSGRLLDPINDSLGRRLVRKVYVVKGAVDMGGGGVSKLPFSSVNGCKTIRDVEEKLRQAEAKNN